MTAFRGVQELARNMENQEDIEMETQMEWKDIEMETQMKWEDIEMKTQMEWEAPSQDIYPDPDAATQAFGDKNQSQIDTEDSDTESHDSEFGSEFQGHYSIGMVVGIVVSFVINGSEIDINVNHNINLPTGIVIGGQNPIAAKRRMKIEE